MSEYLENQINIVIDELKNFQFLELNYTKILIDHNNKKHDELNKGFKHDLKNMKFNVNECRFFIMRLKESKNMSSILIDRIKKCKELINDHLDKYKYFDMYYSEVDNKYPKNGYSVERIYSVINTANFEWLVESIKKFDIKKKQL